MVSADLFRKKIVEGYQGINVSPRESAPPCDVRSDKSVAAPMRLECFPPSLVYDQLARLVSESSWKGNDSALLDKSCS